MNYSQRLVISYYKTIAAINEEHNIFLVQHQDSQKIYIKKIMDVYNAQVYGYLKTHRIAGIPQIIDTYMEEDQLTVIEEFVSGTSLHDMLNTYSLTVDLVIRYMCELCDILSHLHSLNPPIVHRDIKPSNIIISSCGHVMLLDFNAAKFMMNDHVTDTVLLGTEGYAAPEQYGFGSSTPQTDIYALGIMLKELISFLPVPTNIFAPIIKKCTQIDPADRYKTVQLLKQAIMKLNPENINTPSTQETPARLRFIPPGYRTLTPWKMLIASVMYLFIFWLSLTLEVTDASDLSLWIQRIFCLSMMLFIVFGCFNYCDIQRFFPLCKNKNRLLHYLGILMLNITVVFSLLIVMCIIIFFI